jgi:hypothetical protein
VSTTTHKTLRGPRGGMILCKEAYAKEIDRSVFPGTQGGPLMHVIAGKAVCFGEALTPAFRQYARQIVDNAKALAETLLSGGLKLTSGGTDNHLMLADVTVLGLTGRQAEDALGRCHITVNKNMIPFDQRKPMDPSGIRIGTPALTSRGMDCDTMRSIGGWILAVLRAPDDARVQQRVAGEVSALCRQFPVPGIESAFSGATLHSGLPVEVFQALAMKAAIVLSRKDLTLAEFTAEMIGQFGPAFGPYAAEAYQAGLDQLDRGMDKAEVPKEEREAAKKATNGT